MPTVARPLQCLVRLGSTPRRGPSPARSRPPQGYVQPQEVPFNSDPGFSLCFPRARREGLVGTDLPPYQIHNNCDIARLCPNPLGLVLGTANHVRWPDCWTPQLLDFCR